MAIELVKPTQKPIMANEFAAWLIHNTALTFEQIANFCCMEFVVVEGIANGFYAIKGTDPVEYGLLLRSEITRCEKDENAQLLMIKSDFENKIKKQSSYIALKYRPMKQGVILHMLLHYPTMKNSEIIKMLSTTTGTINKLRGFLENPKLNVDNIHAIDPVESGLCKLEDIIRIEQKHVKVEAEQPVQVTKDLIDTDISTKETTTEDTEAAFTKSIEASMGKSALDQHINESKQKSEMSEDEKMFQKALESLDVLNKEDK